MLYPLIRPMRQQGRPARDYSQGEYTGELEYGQSFDELLNRSCRTLTLFRSGMGGARENVLPPLRDATLIAFTVRGMMFTGFERLGAQDVAQSWYVQLVTDWPSHALGAHRR
ncbi:hypothetical protein BH09PSE6_BH09PSE6_07340 [soil metagenome]